MGFIADHSRISAKRIEALMMETGMLTKDVGSILVGERAVKEGLIDEIGGISQALSKLHSMVDKSVCTF